MVKVEGVDRLLVDPEPIVKLTGEEIDAGAVVFDEATGFELNEELELGDT